MDFDNLKEQIATSIKAMEGTLQAKETEVQEKEQQVKIASQEVETKKAEVNVTREQIRRLHGLQATLDAPIRLQGENHATHASGKPQRSPRSNWRQHYDKLPERFTRREVSRMTGANSPNVTRALKDWKDKGWVKNIGRGDYVKGRGDYNKR